MDTLKEYILINEFGEYAVFNESGIFIEWSRERHTTPHKWAVEILFISNPGCTVDIIETITSK